MKKLLILLLAMFINISAMTTSYAFQDTTKKTKSGKLDRRNNANKHLKKDGTMDMRYKSSSSATKKVSSKKTVTP
ncbi:hypothetical protein A0256_20995 [Mucilaginibacter sp. PAMC 26640]|nr:hypothetical protein A0256_20995 [Mucilaginibacter sp. PAMC 26640]